MSTPRTSPSNNPVASQATWLIRRATAHRQGGWVDHKAITAVWDGGTHNVTYVGMCLSGWRKPRQSLMDALFEITGDHQLIIDVKAAAIAAYIDKHPDTDLDFAFVNDVGGR